MPITCASNAEGKQITTIEGWSEGRTADGPASLLEHSLPMRLLHTRLITAVVGLLIELAAPTRGTDRDYLSGNLCRCGTYKEVLAAVESSSRGAARTPSGGS